MRSCQSASPHGTTSRLCRNEVYLAVAFLAMVYALCPVITVILSALQKLIHVAVCVDPSQSFLFFGTGTFIVMLHARLHDDAVAHYSDTKTTGSYGKRFRRHSRGPTILGNSPRRILDSPRSTAEALRSHGLSMVLEHVKEFVCESIRNSRLSLYSSKVTCSEQSRAEAPFTSSSAPISAADTRAFELKRDKHSWRTGEPTSRHSTSSTSHHTTVLTSHHKPYNLRKHKLKLHKTIIIQLQTSTMPNDPPTNNPSQGSGPILRTVGVMPRPGQPGALHFDTADVSEFLRRWNLECEDFGLSDP
jgi:hypothetical protein